MTYIIKYILVVSVVLFNSIQIYSNTGKFRSLSVSEGMTDLVVNTIYKDNRGFVWFGTNSTIERFDGIRLKRYNIEPSDLPLKRIYTITDDGYNDIYCGTNNGIYKLDDKKGVFIKSSYHNIDFTVDYLCKYSTDTLLAATDKGLYICSKSNVRQVLFDNNMFSPLNKITGIVTSPSKSIIWLSTMGGIINYDLDSGSFNVYKTENRNLTNTFYSIVQVQDKLFLGTLDKGIIYFDITSSSFKKYIDVGCNVISSLSCNDNDTLLVGTDGNGVHFISVSKGEIIKSFRHIPGTSGGIRSNSVYSVLVDNEGLLWVGLYQMGVDYTLFQSGLFNVYKWKDDFCSSDVSVRTIAFHDKMKLIGSRDGLIFIDEEKNIIKTFLQPVLRSNMILSSCYYNGLFYIGTYSGGMYVLDPDSLKISDFNGDMINPFRSGNIFCIRPDNNGNLWIGTSDGLFCYNSGVLKYHYTASKSKIPEGNVYEIFFDTTGKGWICTETGMCIWDPISESLKTDVFPEGFINKEKIRAIFESSDNILYFLPEKGPMLRSDLSMNEFEHIDGIPFFKGKSFLSIVEDKDGYFFITTNNGLFRFNGEKDVIPYNFTDGIPSPVFTNCQSYKGEDNSLWFGNTKGLVCLKSGEDNKLRANTYKVVISDIFVNGEVTDKLMYDKEKGEYIFMLDSHQPNLKILFSSLIYSEPSNMVYEYKIGNSGDWVPLIGNSELSLYNVSNSCNVKIRRIGYDKSETVLKVIIDNDKSLFYISIVVIVSLFIIFIYLNRKKITRITVVGLKRIIYFLQSRNGKEMTAFSQADLKTDLCVGDDNTHNIDYGIIDDNNQTGIDSVSIKDSVFENNNIPNTEDLVNEKNIVEKYKTNRLSDEECKRILKILDREMRNEKLYTNQSLKIADLAKVANTTSQSLSYIFNQYLNKSYYDYINEFRVEEFKFMISNDTYSKYTLEALSARCGFSSRASFFRSFKKVTGITPNEYIKNVKGSH